ncbi:MAG: HAD family phosphatase [Acidobacteriota bacterium]
MVQAVLWDNDGILVNSESVFYEITRAAFAQLGLVLTREIWGIRFLGNGVGSREIAMSMGADPEISTGIFDERNARYRELLATNPPKVRSQVKETLAQLYGNVSLAVVTGSHRDQFDFMHRSSGLQHFFETVITGDDAEKPKPHPDLYLAALNALNLGPEECIAVEDSRRGLLAAVAAGIACVVVPTELTRIQEFPGALAVENEISAVLKYI